MRAILFNRRNLKNAYIDEKKIVKIKILLLYLEDAAHITTMPTMFRRNSYE